VVLGATVALGVGTVVGYWIGQERWWRWANDQLKVEVVGYIEHNLEVLSRSRTDDVKGAVRLLETTMDRGVLNLAEGGRRDGVPVSTLQGVRAYHILYPADPKDAERLDSVLSVLPETAPGYCSPAVSAILDRARRHRDEFGDLARRP
jgi:hypothetical protein